jgi:hypothetical protein
MQRANLLNFSMGGSLCSCAAHNNANISHSLVGPTVVDRLGWTGRFISNQQSIRQRRAIEGADVKVIFAATLLSISLCSCAAHNNANISHSLVGPTVVGDGSSVVVSHVRNQTDGQQLAEKHRKRFGKSAQFNRMEGVRAYFDCQSGSLSVNR